MRQHPNLIPIFYIYAPDARISFFRKSGSVRRHTIARINFGRTYADYRIRGKKGLCLMPKQKFRLMMQGPFLFLLYQRGAFTDSRR